jgi:hypothetical protein
VDSVYLISATRIVVFEFAADVWPGIGMQTSDIAGIAQAAFDWLVNKGVLPTLGVVLALLWTVAGTGSTHLITMRLWRLVIGERKTGANKMDDFLDQRDGLMRFRLQTGLRRVGTNRQAEQLVHWVEENDIDVDSVRACGTLFDLQNPGLQEKLPSAGLRLIGLVIATLFFYGALIQGVAIVAAPPFVKVNKTGNWYGASEAGSFQFNLGKKSPHFAASECSDRNVLVSKTGYPKEDVGTLCDLLSSSNHANYLTSAQMAQSGALAVGCAIALGFLALFLNFERQAAAAVRLRKQLESAAGTAARAKSQAQIPSPQDE